MLLIKYKYNAPKKKYTLPVAIPKPAVHNGGIKAVAIATPGITLLFSVLVIAIMPASPPKAAIKTSQIEGEVLAKISDEAS